MGNEKTHNNHRFVGCMFLLELLSKLRPKTIEKPQFNITKRKHKNSKIKQKNQKEKNPHMKTKKALGGLFGLLGSLATFFDCFLLAITPLRFNLHATGPKLKLQIKKTRSQTQKETINNTIPIIGSFSINFNLRHGKNR